MIPFLSILMFLSITLSLFVLLFAIYFIIIPYLRIRSYKSKHFTTHFFPITGIMRTFTNDFHTKDDMYASIKSSSQDYPDQKVLVSNLNSSIFFMLRDSQYIKQFLQNQQYYHKEKHVFFLKPLLLGNGLIYAEDDVWKRHRRIISGSFHYEFLKDNTGLIQETVREFLDKINPSEYKDFDIMSKAQEITGEIIGRVFFGKNFKNYNIDGVPLTLELAAVATDLVISGANPLVFIFGKKALKLPIERFRKMMDRIERFKKVCCDIIEERRDQATQNNDLLASLLLTQRSEDPLNRYSDEDIVNEFITFYAAGMDTTSHLIVMALYALSLYPQFQTELKEERDRTYNKETKVTAETLQKMDILHSILKETLRLYSPASTVFTRVATEDHKVLDLSVKKGDILTVHFHASCYNEKHFKDAREFKPERWKGEQKIDPYAFIPFSAGPRNCIGQYLAMIQAKVAVSEFLERFEFKVREGYKMRFMWRFSYGPYDKMLLNLKPITN